MITYYSERGQIFSATVIGTYPNFKEEECYIVEIHDVESYGRETDGFHSMYLRNGTKLDKILK